MASGGRCSSFAAFTAVLGIIVWIGSMIEQWHIDRASRHPRPPRPRTTYHSNRSNRNSGGGGWIGGRYDSEGNYIDPYDDGFDCDGGY